MEAKGWEAYLKRACPSACKPKQTVLVTERDFWGSERETEPESISSATWIAGCPD